MDILIISYFFFLNRHKFDVLKGRLYHLAPLLKLLIMFMLSVFLFFSRGGVSCPEL